MLVAPFSLSPPHTPFFYINVLVSRLGTAIAVPPPSDRRARTQWRKILIRRKLVTFQAATSFEGPADDKVTLVFWHPSAIGEVRTQARQLHIPLTAHELGAAAYSRPLHIPPPVQRVQRSIRTCQTSHLPVSDSQTRHAMIASYTLTYARRAGYTTGVPPAMAYGNSRVVAPNGPRYHL
jgi:hypothetical protein